MKKSNTAEITEDTSLRESELAGDASLSDNELAGDASIGDSVSAKNASIGDSVSAKDASLEDSVRDNGVSIRDNNDGYIYNDAYVGDDDYYYEDPLISLFDVEKEYDNGTVRALNRINLDIFEGEFVSIIGPSGSGKSTLLNMLGALDKSSRGEIYIDGINLLKEKDLSDFRREEIGFVFQLHNLIPNLSVLDNVQIPLLHTGMSSKDMKRKAEGLIRAVGLESKKKQKPNKLSGGERQRVAIARALVNDPSIILADEPTGSLDSKTGQMILNVLIKMHEAYNVTLIIVTHDIDVANLAERTIQIKDGQIIEDKYNY